MCQFKLIQTQDFCVETHETGLEENRYLNMNLLEERLRAAA